MLRLKKIWLLLIGAEEVVNGLPIVRDKKQPSLCYVITPWYESIFFGPYSTLVFRDKKHPHYKELWKNRLKNIKNVKLND